MKNLIQDCKKDLHEYYTTELLNKLNNKQVFQLHDYHFDSVCNLQPDQMICDDNEFERYLSDLICEYAVLRFYKPRLSA